MRHGKRNLITFILIQILILTQNLYGLGINTQLPQLASFSLIQKQIQKEKPINKDFSQIISPLKNIKQKAEQQELEYRSHWLNKYYENIKNLIFTPYLLYVDPTSALVMLEQKCDEIFVFKQNQLKQDLELELQSQDKDLEEIERLQTEILEIQTTRWIIWFMALTLNPSAKARYKLFSWTGLALTNILSKFNTESKTSKTIGPYIYFVMSLIRDSRTWENIASKGAAKYNGKELRKEYESLLKDYEFLEENSYTLLEEGKEINLDQRAQDWKNDYTKFVREWGVSPFWHTDPVEQETGIKAETQKQLQESWYSKTLNTVKDSFGKTYRWLRPEREEEQSLMQRVKAFELPKGFGLGLATIGVFFNSPILMSFGVLDLPGARAGSSSSSFSTEVNVKHSFISNVQPYQTDPSDLKLTKDGGYIVPGSLGYDQQCAIVIKFDHNGRAVWQKSYRKGDNGSFSSIQLTPEDDGFIVVGDMSLKKEYASPDDALILKIDGFGNELWAKSFGRENYWDHASCVQLTLDGGYIVTGTSNSYTVGSYDVFVLKLDKNGNSEWAKSFGGYDSDSSNTIYPTSDGGYVLAGTTKSFGSGGSDVFVMKLNKQGDVVLSKTFGGEKDDSTIALIPTSDGNYILTGRTSSFGQGNVASFVMKLDKEFNNIWSKVYGGPANYHVSGIEETLDGGYVLAGAVSPRFSFITKIDANGNLLSHKISHDQGYRSDNFNKIKLTSDGGNVAVGITYNYGASNHGYFLVKVDEHGNVTGYDLFTDSSDLIVEDIIKKPVSFDPMIGTIGDGTKDISLEISDISTWSAGYTDKEVYLNNHNPEIVPGVMQDQTAYVGEEFSYTIPENAILDVDGDRLHYNATDINTHKNIVDGLNLQVAAPKVLSSYTCSGPVKHVYIKDEIAYVSCADKGVEVLNIKNKFKPILLYRINGINAYSVNFKDDNTMYTLDKDNFITAVLIKDRDNHEVINTYEYDEVGGISIYKNRMFIANGSKGLYVLDITNSRSPNELYVHFKEEGNVQDVYVNGKVAYVVISEKLQVLDISNPGEPKKLAELDFANNNIVSDKYRLSFNNKMLYVLGQEDEDNSFVVKIDVSDKTKPLLAERYKLEGKVYNFNACEDKGLAADNFLRVLDLNPDTFKGVPDKKGVLSLNLEVKDDFGGTVSETLNINVLDKGMIVPDLLEYTINNSNLLSGFKIVGYKGQRGSLKIKLSIPVKQAISIGKIGTASSNYNDNTGEWFAQGLVSDINQLLEQTYLKSAKDLGDNLNMRVTFTSDNSEVFSKIVNLEANYNPVLTNSIGAQELYVGRDFVFETPGMMFLDPNNNKLFYNVTVDDGPVSDFINFEMFNPEVLGERIVPFAIDQTAKDGKIYVTDKRGGVVVFDASNPRLIKMIGNYLVEKVSQGLFVSNDNIAYIGYENGVMIIDVNNPRECFKDPGSCFGAALGKIDLSVSPKEIVVQKFSAYIANGSEGLVMFDIKKPFKTKKLGSYKTQGDIYSVKVLDKTAYVLVQDGGLETVNVKNPAKSKRLGKYGSNTSFIDMAVSENRVYLLEKGANVVVLDSSDPANLKKIGSYETEEDAVSLKVSGNMLFLGTKDSLEIIDFTNVSNPCNVKTIKTSDNILKQISNISLDKNFVSMLFLRDSQIQLVGGIKPATFYGTPSSDDLGEHNITIKAHDGKGGFAETEIPLNVLGKEIPSYVKFIKENSFLLEGLGAVAMIAFIGTAFTGFMYLNRRRAKQQIRREAMSLDLSRQEQKEFGDVEMQEPEYAEERMEEQSNYENSDLDYGDLVMEEDALQQEIRIDIDPTVSSEESSFLLATSRFFKKEIGETKIIQKNPEEIIKHDDKFSNNIKEKLVSTAKKLQTTIQDRLAKNKLEGGQIILDEDVLTYFEQSLFVIIGNEYYQLEMKSQKLYKNWKQDKVVEQKLEADSLIRVLKEIDLDLLQTFKQELSGYLDYLELEVENGQEQIKDFEKMLELIKKVEQDKQGKNLLSKLKVGEDEYLLDQLDELCQKEIDTNNEIPLSMVFDETISALISA